LGLPGPNVQNLNLTDSFGSPLGPSLAHPFGVDSLGEDVMSRVIYGTRVSLEVGIIGTGISTLIGVVIGMVAGFYRGWVDTGLSRLIDVVLSVPVLLLGLGLGAACSVRGCAKGLIQPGLGTILFIVALSTWPYIARIVRGLVLSMREREFVEAARALGASDARIMFREILPNLAAPIIVYGSLLVPVSILLEAALSFLGVGIRPPTASWGQMIAAATPIFNTAWWYMVFPGAALLLTVLAFNLLGDGLQDALNPRNAQ
ncbi:MAG: binding-protein-dependent transport system inner rane component, partial [Solirubrobacterales bacterium]|nr:binding-protein-dependent transport system inner rane component [Solirubrobacterales bacterium]